jgi:hypothetical protein
MLRRLHAVRIVGPRELSEFPRIVVMLPFDASFGEETIMRWKISHHGHDPRQIDLLAIVALIVVIVSAYSYLAHRAASPPSTTAFIEPSQSVRW